MKKKILFIERKSSSAVSIEKVFEQVAASLADANFETSFQKLRYPNDLLGTIKNLVTFKKLTADIYHITGHVHYIALLLPPESTVLTIHDAGILRIRRGLRRYILKKLLFDLPLKRLKYITAVSETTKKDLISHTECNAHKIRVIENPLRNDFYLKEKKNFNTLKPSILQIGTTANKNLPNLIEALENVECRLKIIGEINAETTDLLKEKRIDYENNSNLTDEEIKNEYAEADLITFCSTFEGFGLPIIEAQAMLTPVITSDLDPMKTVAGQGAALVDPHDPGSIRNGIMRVISDRNYRKYLVAEGLNNIQKYRPETIAARYENLYKEIFADAEQNKKKQEND